MSVRKSTKSKPSIASKPKTPNQKAKTPKKLGLRDWKKKFYPIAAGTAARQGPLEAALHSLKKWQGLLPKNLSQYELRHTSGGIMENGWLLKEFYFDTTTCSLCQRYWKKTLAPGYSCGHCPVLQVNGGRPCFSCQPDGHPTYDLEKPYAMIRLLEKVVELERRKLKARKKKTVKKALRKGKKK